MHNAPVARTEPASRFGELDSLRGLAAFAVVLGHFLYTFGPQAPVWASSGRALDAPPLSAGALWTWLDRFTPLHVFVAGPEAVMLFFVLSGFVLSLPYNAGRPQPYITFAARRICRIYLPYLAALAFAVALNAAFSTGGIPSLGPWFNNTWRLPVTGKEIVDHVLFVGNYDYARFNTAFWSLVHEMRVSLVFPALMLAVRFRWSVNLLLAACLSIAARAVMYLAPQLANHMTTVHYAAFFILGATIAANRSGIAEVYGHMNGTAKGVYFGLALAMYSYGRYAGRLDQWFQAVGASLLIIAALNDRRFTALLHLRLLRKLGNMSYSLYLLHATCLFSCVYLMYPRVPVALIFVVYVPAALAVSYASYLYVEVPAIALGKYVSKRLARKPEEHPSVRRFQWPHRAAPQLGRVRHNGSARPHESPSAAAHGRAAGCDRVGSPVRAGSDPHAS